MGVVVHYKDNVLDKSVAIKFLLDSENPVVAARFHREAKAAAKLNHPNILNVIDFGISDDQRLYLVMDYLEGEGLDEFLKRKQQVSTEEAIRILKQICIGLTHAHNAGLVHRDIKPSNVMLSSLEDSDNNVRILDFGIAKFVETDQRLTATGGIIGTPAYMSPEAGKGIELDKRADVYSFGCLMFELLSGKKVFHGNSSMETIMMHMEETPPSLFEVSGQEFDSRIEETVSKCLKKDPLDRFKSMEEIFDALSIIEQTAPVFSSDTAIIYDTKEKQRSSKPLIIIASLLSVLFVVGVTFAVLNLNRKETDKPKPLKKTISTISDNLKEGASPDSQPIKFSTCGDSRSLFRVNFLSDFPPTRLGELARLAKKEGIRELKLPWNKFCGPGVEDFAKLDIDYLDVQDSQLDRLALESIAKIKTLKTLNMEGVRGLKGEDFNRLKDCDSLETLSFKKCRLGDEIFPGLAQLKNLSFLDLDKSKKISGKGIGELKSVNRIFLRESGFDPENVKEFTRMPRLQNLALDRVPINSKHLAVIKTLKLRYLSLNNNQLLSEQDLKSIAGMKYLNNLSLDNCKNATPEVVQYLEKRNFVKLVISKSDSSPSRSDKFKDFY